MTKHKPISRALLGGAAMSVAMGMSACGPLGGGGDDEAEGSVVEGEAVEGGILVAEGSHRFYNLDWTVGDIERRPDGPEDEGEDVDASEDFVYVDLTATSPADTVGYSQFPIDWIGLADGEGQVVRASSAIHGGTDEVLAGSFSIDPNRSVDLRAVIPVGADDSFEGGWVELNDPDTLPAALGGSNVRDETERVPAEFDTTTYDGPYSRDEATVEIVEAFWSRELGFDETDEPLESPTGDPRAPVGEVFLTVRFEVSCRLTGLSTGGCNAAGGRALIDGKGTAGTSIVALAGYGKTATLVDTYNVPADAESVIVDLCECDDENGTDFEVTDLGPVDELVGN